LPVRQADLVSEVTGPPKSVAYDVGRRADTPPLSALAEKQGVALHEIYFLQTAKGEYLGCKET